MATINSIRQGPAASGSLKSVALALLLGASIVAAAPAHAGMSLATVAAATGTPTVAPLLKTITPAVVTIAIKGHVSEANASGARQRQPQPF